MEFPTFFALKLVVYFLVLLAGVFAFQRLGHPRRGVLLLVPLVLGRAVLGVALGFVILGVADRIHMTNANDFFTPVGIGVVGFCLWLAAAKVAFRTPPLLQLAAFSLGAEVVSLTMDYFMVAQASRLIH